MSTRNRNVGLTGATTAAQPSANDPTVTTTYAEDATSATTRDTKGTLTVTMQAATQPGEKTLVLQTPKGQATVKITLT